MEVAEKEGMGRKRGAQGDWLVVATLPCRTYRETEKERAADRGWWREKGSAQF